MYSLKSKRFPPVLSLEGVREWVKKGLYIQAAPPHPTPSTPTLPIRFQAVGGSRVVRKGGRANINYKDWQTGNATCPSRELWL